MITRVGFGLRGPFLFLAAEMPPLFLFLGVSEIAPKPR